MLIEYHHYCILLQIMLNVTTTTVGFRHNIPLFPLLCRLYFSRIRPCSVIILTHRTRSLRIPTRPHSCAIPTIMHSTHLLLFSDTGLG